MAQFFKPQKKSTQLQRIEFTIDTLDHHCVGIGRHQGKAIFVEGALPGETVKARITVDRAAADLVVPITALQTAEDQDVVYVQQDDVYHTRPVKLGRRDAERVEVLEGLKAGEHVVVAQSFLIKADIEKSTVEEDH